MENITKVGILGSGSVAQTLAAGFRAKGYAVMVGSRTPAKLADWAATQPGIETGDFAAAAAFGELLVLAVKGTAAAAALGLAGAENLAGKVVIDATNPIADAPPVEGALQFTTGPNESAMEALQAAYPAARFVKAFNSVGASRMVDPDFPGGPPTMFLCGDDPAAKAVVSALLEQFGWEPLDMGLAVSARAIEPLCILWCLRGFRDNQWTHAFKLLH